MIFTEKTKSRHVPPSSRTDRRNRSESSDRTRVKSAKEHKARIRADEKPASDPVTFQIQREQRPNGLRIPPLEAPAPWEAICKRLEAESAKNALTFTLEEDGGIALGGSIETAQKLLGKVEQAISFLEALGADRNEACKMLESDKLWRALTSGEGLPHPEQFKWNDRRALQRICRAFAACAATPLAVRLLKAVPPWMCVRCLTEGNAPFKIVPKDRASRNAWKEIVVLAAHAARTDHQWEAVEKCFAMAPSSVKPTIAALLLPEDKKDLSELDLVSGLCACAGNRVGPSLDDQLHCLRQDRSSIERRRSVALGRTPESCRDSC